MATDIYQHIQAGLVEKRQTLKGFIETASETEKDIACAKTRLVLMSTCT